MKSFIPSLNFYHYTLLLAVVVYSITAFNSHGYFHADEHYQLIEFAGLKLGVNTENDLAWEYKARLRSGIQPGFAFVVLKVLNNLYLSDPYFQAFILRLLSAAMALLIIHFFLQTSQACFITDTGKKIYYLLSYFLWFIPVIAVRFSSETWSGLLFLLALSLYLWSNRNLRKTYLIGSVLGLGFLFRYQLAFAILGFLLWLMIIERKRVLFFFKIFASFLVVFLFGILVDAWMYGELVFVPWNYFNNTILENAGAGFGNSPWYFYFEKLLSYPSYPIGILLYMSLIFVLVYQPRNLFIWCIIPFVLVHSAVPHKEERFLFSMVFIFPVIIGFFIDYLLNEYRKNRVFQYVTGLVSIFLIVLNLTGLFAMAQKAAGIGRMGITRYIHDHHQKGRINIIHTNWANPYNPWNSIPVNFYLEKDLRNVMINSLCGLNDSLLVPEADNYLIVRKSDLENSECIKMIGESNFVLLKQSIPLWIEKLNSCYRGFENYNILVLYHYVNVKSE